MTDTHHIEASGDLPLQQRGHQTRGSYAGVRALSNRR
jgi:hypothetical protein